MSKTNNKIENLTQAVHNLLFALVLIGFIILYYNNIKFEQQIQDLEERIHVQEVEFNEVLDDIYDEIYDLIDYYETDNYNITLT